MDNQKRQRILNELYTVKGAVEHARLTLVTDAGTQREFLEELKAAKFKMETIIADVEKVEIPQSSPRSSEERQEQQ